MQSKSLCERIHFLSFTDPGRGTLIPIEGESDIPFQIARQWDIRNVPMGGIRGGHAHKEAKQVIRAMAGSFWVVATKDENFSLHYLSAPEAALYVPPNVRVDLIGFSDNAICQVFSDKHYEEEDYISEGPNV